MTTQTLEEKLINVKTLKFPKRWTVILDPTKIVLMSSVMEIWKHTLKTKHGWFYCSQTSVTELTGIPIRTQNYQFNILQKMKLLEIKIENGCRRMIRLNTKKLLKS